MTFFQPRRQLRHGYIRLRLYLGDNDVLERPQFAATARPSSSGRHDRARSIRPLLEPNCRGGRNFESSSGGSARFALSYRIDNPLAKVLE